jgi:hypothetical protein
MSNRVNIVLDDEVWESLQLVPKGERSKVINQALSAWIVRSRRSSAIQRMDELRSKMKPVRGSAEQWMREDRRRHR